MEGVRRGPPNAVRHHGEEKEEEEEEEMFYSGDEHVDEKEGPILGALRPHCESTAQMYTDEDKFHSFCRMSQSSFRASCIQSGQS